MEKMFIPNELKTGEKITDTEEMTHIIGVNLKRARLERGFSLDEVSAKSTVSKSMLSDIERGRKCPTVAILCKICDGIQVSLPSLLKAPEKIVEVVQKQEFAKKEGLELQQMFEFDINTSMEVYRFRIAPNTEVPAEAHSERVWEYIMVVDGTLTLILDDDQYEIKKGGAIRFLSNRKHTYANRTGKELLAFRSVYYGG